MKAQWAARRKAAAKTKEIYKAHPYLLQNSQELIKLGGI
jgi:hypothetical protein